MATKSNKDQTPPATPSPDPEIKDQTPPAPEQKNEDLARTTPAAPADDATALAHKQNHTTPGGRYRVDVTPQNPRGRLVDANGNEIKE